MAFRPSRRKIIDDTTASSDRSYSSNKINNELQGKNLLDNPWFTVNQRRSTVAQDTFGCDRWGGIYTWNNNIVSLSANNYIIQFFEDNFKAALNGKMVTVSIMLANGNIISGSNTYSSSSDVTYIDTEMLSCSSFNGIEYALGITAKTTFDIKAVKLELGTVSTLSSDTYPDYAFELAKCQSRKFDNDLYTNQGRILMTKDQKDNGAYNLLPNNGTTQVKNGITFTFNSDGTVTVQGTLAPGQEYAIIRIYQDETHNLPSGTYRLCGCPTPNESHDFWFNVWDANADVKEYGSGADFTITAGVRFYAAIVIHADVPNAITFKPMLTTDLNATYDDYVPYAKTNRELTEDIKITTYTKTTDNTGECSIGSDSAYVPIGGSIIGTQNTHTGAISFRTASSDRNSYYAMFYTATSSALNVVANKELTFIVVWVKKA